MEESKILDCRNLRISFRTLNGTVKAVRGIDFQLYRGKTLAIVGESGSGKSVTSKAVMGILAPNKIVEEGEILYGDKDLLQISEEEFCKLRGSKISMIFQDPFSSLNPIKKVGIQITESMKLKRASARKEAKYNFKYSKKIYDDFIAKHPDCGYSSKDLDQVVEMYKNKNSSEEAFKLSKFDRITNDNVISYEKTILATVNEAKKQKLSEQMAAYKSKRAIKHEELQKALDSANEKIAETHTDYTKYDLTSLNKLTEKIFAEYYKDLLKRYQENSKKLEETFSKFASLDGDEFINAVKANIKDMNGYVLACQNDLALEKDELIYTFGVSIKHLVKDYYLRKKDELKKEKTAEKNKKKEAAGKSTDLTAKQKAWASEINTASCTKVEKIKNQIASVIDALKTDYVKNLTEAMEEKNTKKNAEAYVKAFTDGIVTYSHPVNNEEIIERAINILGLVGIPEPQKRIKQYPFEFSGGMRQRIVIAIALSSNPEILICDEPTTALDVTIQAQILELINDLKKKLNLSIIFITHNLGVVANMADDIAVMYAGKIVEYGTVDEIFYEPKHPYTWALLASMPDLETKTKLDAIPGAPPNMIIPPKGDAFAARNKYAMKIDFEKEPPHFYVSPTHWAATWLLAKGAPKVEPPTIVTERINRMKKLNAEANKEKE